ncbi:hypothetical protein D4764_14G0004850 [Takifugu flavidus]|uniref:Uncharacterized protein n=1 Tax=Takifugu flavidus TaxID=433684 RepID=A0A5C6P402_9TELE|nr:hypothetical protein D4764_14G0004850 [Takifugu flavidus]
MKLLRYVVVADPNAGQDTVGDREEAASARPRSIGDESPHQMQSPWTAGNSEHRSIGESPHQMQSPGLLGTRNTGESSTRSSPPGTARTRESPARHAHHMNVPRDTEGRGSPPRLQGGQERSSRRHGTATGEALKGKPEVRGQEWPSRATGTQEQERSSSETGSTGIGATLQETQSTNDRGSDQTASPQTDTLPTPRNPNKHPH